MGKICHCCDRKDCPALAMPEKPHPGWQTDQETGEEYICTCGPCLESADARRRAGADCLAHRVDWRSRALAAEADLTALRERMRWVPVSERLPDEYEDVLAVLVQNYPKGHFVVEAHMIRDIDGVPCWRRNGQMIPDPVLWQPMPAAPEVQNG